MLSSCRFGQKAATVRTILLGSIFWPLSNANETRPGQDAASLSKTVSVMRLPNPENANLTRWAPTFRNMPAQGTSDR